MKKFLMFLCGIFICVICFADTINLTWKVDNALYDTSTCTTGGDLILPTTPTKYGYTFTGWEFAKMLPIEYLESTGTQWIDTEIKQYDYAHDLIIRSKFAFNTSNETTTLCGSKMNNANFICLVSSSNRLLSNIGYDGNHLDLGPSDTGIHTIICNSNDGTVTFDNAVHAYRDNTSSLSNNIYCFGRNQNGTANPGKMKIYNLSFSTGTGALIRDFIPVIDPSGIPCMYDKVTKQFFYNSGTGQFIAGPVLNE